MKKNRFLLFMIFILVVVLSSCHKNAKIEISKDEEDTVCYFHLYEHITLKKGDCNSDKESMSLTPWQVEELLNQEYGKRFLLEKLKETQKTVYIINTGTNGMYYVSGFYLKNGKPKQLKESEINLWGYPVNIIGTN